MYQTILFLTPYPYSTAPSQRFRFEQYYPALQKQGIQYKEASFLDNGTWKILYYPGKTIQKTSGIIKGFLRRFFLLFTLSKHDYIFIHREATPIGPPIFEWIIAKALRKKIIYDFDDAIWIPNTSEQNKIAAVVKWHHKVPSICKWSYKVSVGNTYLAEYARQFNKNVVINPTTIDTEGVHNIIKEHLGAVISSPSAKRALPQGDNLLTAIPESSSLNQTDSFVPPSGEGSKPTPPLEGRGVNTKLTSTLEDPGTKTIVGWTGSHSTLPYINEIIPVLQKLEKEYNFEFQVISNQDPNLPLSNFKFIKWKKETEIKDLSKFDIGLMPLTEDKWAKGKCGFKALQYMALGIPPLVSPVGVNTEIVQHEQNGFICSTEADWLKYITQLLEQPELRRKIGIEARRTVVERYSVKSNTENFLRLFV